MEKYKIIQLNNEPFDFLIIANSFENPLSYMEDIIKRIRVDYAKILFDLTLINGTSKNRYILCDYSRTRSYLRSCKIVDSIDISISEITSNYFRENPSIVYNSPISNALKFLLTVEKV